MALDKHRLLNELGSVMNQLQSADCGCMGKLFSNQNQSTPPNVNMESPLPVQGSGCRHSCCHNHGHHSSNSYRGDNSMVNPPTQMPHCMGHCNPANLYSETYNYLNDNLMKPVVNEVYNDLRSITPANTVMNNPIAKRMGLSNEKTGAGDLAYQAQMGNGGMPAGNNMGSYPPTNATNSNQMPQMPQMGGMGPGIVNMMMEGAKPNQHISEPNQSHGQEGIVPGSPAGHNLGNINSTPHGQLMQNPITTQHVTTMGHSVQNPVASELMQLPNAQKQQCFRSAPNTPHNAYGIHTPGIQKFKEMFPGVMQGQGEELGFDPMELAIQMNPANKTQTAVSNMKRMMLGNLQDPNPQLTNIPHNQTIANQEKVAQSMLQPQQLANPEQTSPPNQAIPKQQQQVYNIQNQPPDATQIQQQHMQVNPSGSPAEKHVNQEISKVPIESSSMPAQKYYEYNTLGQPVEMLPAKLFQPPPAPNHYPQTLSPQPVPARLQYNPANSVKNTTSKTSLTGNKTVARNTSRSQLHHIYNQYKGSQSLTQQNIRPANYGGTYSDAKLNVAHANIPVHRPAPVEKLGGDTTTSVNQDRGNVEPAVEQIGDVADPVAEKLQRDIPPPAQTRKTRNGLQDMVYTSGPVSAAWSFHGVR